MKSLANKLFKPSIKSSLNLRNKFTRKAGNCFGCDAKITQTNSNVKFLHFQKSHFSKNKVFCKASSPYTLNLDGDMLINKNAFTYPLIVKIICSCK